MDTPLISRLAAFVAHHPLPTNAAITETIRLALIDTLGCCLAGAREPVSANTLATVRAWGNGPAPVFGHGVTLPSPWAAMVNGVSGHAQDYDDCEYAGNTHPSVVILPALLACAPGKSISGEALIKAYLVGFELLARLGEGLNFEHYNRGWHSTATFGPLAAAGAVSRLLGLNQSQSAHALSVAVSMAAGLTNQFGSDAKPLQAGFAAKAGLLAASLAAQGLAGQALVLEGERGYGALTSHGDTDRLHAALDKLGQPLAIAEHGLVLKRYPGCGYIHRLVDAALLIRQRMGDTLADIVSIHARLPDFHAAILPFRHPTTTAEGLFSVPYGIAAALLRGPLGLADFSTEQLSDPAVNQLIEKVSLATYAPRHPQINFHPDDPDTLTITDREGRVWQETVAFPLGSAPNPMSAVQVLEKFHGNTGFSPTQALLDWPQATDINPLLEHLVT